MTKRFSLILNSRSRPVLLDGLLNSVLVNTQNLDSIEVLIRFDNDDPYTIQNKQVVDKYNFVKSFYGDRITNVHTSLNILAHQSIGDYIWVLNDDCIISTKDWDAVYPILQEKNSICYIHVHDNSCDKVFGQKYASFPMLSREAYDRLGYFMSEQFAGLGGDVHLYRIFEQAHKVVHTDIHIDHVLHRTPHQVANPDNTALNMRQNTATGACDWFMCNISEDVKKIS